MPWAMARRELADYGRPGARTTGLSGPAAVDVGRVLRIVPPVPAPPLRNRRSDSRPPHDNNDGEALRPPSSLAIRIVNNSLRSLRTNPIGAGESNRGDRRADRTQARAPT